MQTQRIEYDDAIVRKFIFASVLRMSSGSPDKATHRNGPLPRQNRGRTYAGTKPGKSKALATPSSFATWRMLLP